MDLRQLNCLDGLLVDGLQKEEGDRQRPKIYLARTAGGKNRAHHQYKKNIAMADRLVILYPA